MKVPLIPKRGQYHYRPMYGVQLGYTYGHAKDVRSSITYLIFIPRSEFDIIP